MTVALRLVVGWMVCALAVAVWYRARCWQDAGSGAGAAASAVMLPAAQRDAITRYLLAGMVARGSARLSAENVLLARAEIWQDRLHWRDLDVTTDWNGRVDRIVISNPLGRDVDIVISVF